MPAAAILTVGTELVEGVRLDTNTRDIAFRLAGAGYKVGEAVSVGDDRRLVAQTIERLVSSYDLVVTTGGLGPTHDDVTLEAAAIALGVELAVDETLVPSLEAAAARHSRPGAATRVMRQALVVPGAAVFAPSSGTAPGQLVDLATSRLLLLPGPPHELRPMLDAFIAAEPGARIPPYEIACTGISESDAQVTAEEALAGSPGISLTVLAHPGDVRVILIDDGGGPDALAHAADVTLHALGDVVYSTDGSSLAEVVIDSARRAGCRLGIAESCTGGMISAALTEIPGSSDVFAGAIVSYADEVKASALGVSAHTLAEHGAVSGPVAREMASGALSALKVDVALSVTGIAGPDGGSDEKPVGTVWFGIEGPAGADQSMRLFPGDRHGVRLRATAHGLDLLRRALGELPATRG